MAPATATIAHPLGPAAAVRRLGDVRLARLAAAGNTDAFAAIYERHHQALYRYCRSILRDPDDASDALQNTMTAALRVLPGEKREIALRPWLYRIAHNEAITLLRRRRPHADLEDAEQLPTASVESDAERREGLRQLVEDLGRLPERQRGALLMRELGGLSYDEVGGALEMSVGAAQQAVYEARLGLRDLEEGRDMECDSARRSLSARDRRLLRGRRLRAHLRACSSCAAFGKDLEARPVAVAALVPPLTPAASAALLEGILGSGAGGGGASMALAGGAAGKGATAAFAAKSVATGLIAVTAGVAGVEIADRSERPSPREGWGLIGDADQALSESRLAAGERRPRRHGGSGAAAGDRASRGRARSEPRTASVPLEERRTADASVPDAPGAAPTSPRVPAGPPAGARGGAPGAGGRELAHDTVKDRVPQDLPPVAGEPYRPPAPGRPASGPGGDPVVDQAPDGTPRPSMGGSRSEVSPDIP